MHLLRYGFIGAGITNIVGVLLFSRLFSNQALSAASPALMSNVGLVMIIVWGFAYISVANGHAGVPWLSALFAVEKLIYTLSWVFWIQSNDLSALYSKDLFAGVFYTIYGINDFVFMLFFACAF